MFGRIRASPSPLECLESERQKTPSKLFKGDSLSIYEATLMKLKQGSKRSLSVEEHDIIMGPASQDSMDFESDGNVSEDSSKVSGLSSQQGMSPCNSESSSASSSSSPSEERKKGKEVSIQFLFSRYNSSHTKQGSCNTEIVRHSSMNSTEIIGYSSMNNIASNSDSEESRG